MFLIYKHTFNNKSYIGYTKNTITQRFNEHCKNAKNGSHTKFHKAIRKYGEENFISEILCNNIETIEEAKKLEKEFIIKFNTFGRISDGYNMTPGGDGVQLFGEDNGMYGKNHTPESIQKMKDNNKPMFGSDNAWHKSNRTEEELKERAQNVAESRKLNGTYSLEYNGMYGKNHTCESKQKMKDTIEENGGRSGENNSFYGKKHTEKTKSLISQANSGRIKTPEEIEKARASNTGKKRTKETCSNISKALSGKPQKKVECPYCNKVGGSSNMTRYHFNNCKDFKLI
jgi:group I intron endonuclease